MMMKNTFTWTKRMWLAVLYSLELVSSRVSLSLVSLTMPTMESLLARNSQWEAFKTVIFVHLYFYLLNIYKMLLKSKLTKQIGWVTHFENFCVIWTKSKIRFQILCSILSVHCTSSLSKDIFKALAFTFQLATKLGMNSIRKAESKNLIQCFVKCT